MPSLTDSPANPNERGFLDVGDGYQIHWETWGNDRGKPALWLHGGPGSGFTTSALRYFDATAYRIVLFDQRGCGLSTPSASAPTVDLSTNTTSHLISDVEQLRTYLGITCWSIVGGSWGTTLALAYAEKHPDRVTDMVLFSVTNTSQAEVDWITQGAGMFFPEAWARFRDNAALRHPDERIIDAYHRLLMHPDPAIHATAARDWCDWEIAIGGPSPRYDDATFRLGFARLVTHYWRNHAWIEDSAILREASQLSGIPAVLIHGRLDIGSPLITAWNLSQAWPGSKLIVVDEAGHGSGHSGMLEQIRRATDGFAAA